MKTLNAACAVAALTAMSMSAIAAEPMMMDHADEMKQMDTNGDGMISKAEFTKYHDAMWTKMPKNSSGMVDVKAMQSMKGTMGNGPMEHGSMGKGAMGSDSSMGRDSMPPDRRSADPMKR